MGNWLRVAVCGALLGLLCGMQAAEPEWTAAQLAGDADSIALTQHRFLAEGGWLAWGGSPWRRHLLRQNGESFPEEQERAGTELAEYCWSLLIAGDRQQAGSLAEKLPEAERQLIEIIRDRDWQRLWPEAEPPKDLSLRQHVVLQILLADSGQQRRLQRLPKHPQQGPWVPLLARYHFGEKVASALCRACRDAGLQWLPEELRETWRSQWQDLGEVTDPGSRQTLASLVTSWQWLLATYGNMGKTDVRAVRGRSLLLRLLISIDACRQQSSLAPSELLDVLSSNDSALQLLTGQRGKTERNKLQLAFESWPDSCVALLNDRCDLKELTNHNNSRFLGRMSEEPAAGCPIGWAVALRRLGAPKGTHAKNLLLQLADADPRNIDLLQYASQNRTMPPFKHLQPSGRWICKKTEFVSLRNDGQKTSRVENFAIRYEGYLKIPKDGRYYFYLQSDDGSQLFLNGRMIIDNSGRHAMSDQTEKYRYQRLSKGEHRIRLDYYEADGAEGLKLRWKGEEIKKKTFIEEKYLSHGVKRQPGLQAQWFALSSHQVPDAQGSGPANLEVMSQDMPGHLRLTALVIDRMIEAKRHVDSLVLLQRYLKEIPDAHDRRLLLVQALMQSGKADEAQAELARIEAAEGVSDAITRQVNFARGRLAFNAGAFAEAQRHLEAVGQNEEAQTLLVKVLLKLKKREAAFLVAQDLQEHFNGGGMEHLLLRLDLLPEDQRLGLAEQLAKLTPEDFSKETMLELVDQLWARGLIQWLWQTKIFSKEMDTRRAYAHLLLVLDTGQFGSVLYGCEELLKRPGFKTDLDMRQQLVVACLYRSMKGAFGRKVSLLGDFNRRVAKKDLTPLAVFWRNWGKEEGEAVQQARSAEPMVSYLSAIRELAARRHAEAQVVLQGQSDFGPAQRLLAWYRAQTAKDLEALFVVAK